MAISCNHCHHCERFSGPGPSLFASWDCMHWSSPGRLAAVSENSGIFHYTPSKISIPVIPVYHLWKPPFIRSSVWTNAFSYHGPTLLRVEFRKSFAVTKAFEVTVNKCSTGPVDIVTATLQQRIVPCWDFLSLLPDWLWLRCL